MKRGTKITLIFGLILIILGLSLMILALSVGADFKETGLIIQENFDFFDDDKIKQEYFMDNSMSKDLVLRGSSIPANYINNLKIELAACEAIIVSGSDFAVHSTRNNCNIKQEGNSLKIEGRKNWFPFDFGRPNKIKITVPVNHFFDNLEIELGAGKLTSNTSIKTKTFEAEIGMGECILSNINSTENLDVKVGMGNMEIQGYFQEKLKLECGMGNISVKTAGKASDYSYKAEVGMGSVRINSTEITGIGGNSVSPYTAKNHIKIECGLGSVSVQTTEK